MSTIKILNWIDVEFRDTVMRRTGSVKVKLRVIAKVTRICDCACSDAPSPDLSGASHDSFSIGNWLITGYFSQQT